MRLRDRIIGFLLVGGVVVLGVTQGVFTKDSVSSILILIPVIVFHELAHGVVANICGDDTAKKAGRLTLNPLAHIDLFGTVILPTLLVLGGLPGFGYAKPVPVNVSNLRNPRRDGLFVGLAGPISNFFMTALTVGLIGILWSLYPDATFFKYIIYFGLANIYIGAFNLLPVPPLDGSSLLEVFIPNRWLGAYYKFRQYAMILLLLLVLSSTPVIGRATSVITSPLTKSYQWAIEQVTPDKSREDVPPSQ